MCCRLAGALVNYLKELGVSQGDGVDKDGGRIVSVRKCAHRHESARIGVLEHHCAEVRERLLIRKQRFRSVLLWVDVNGHASTTSTLPPRLAAISCRKTARPARYSRTSFFFRDLGGGTSGDHSPRRPP